MRHMEKPPVLPLPEPLHDGSLEGQNRKPAMMIASIHGRLCVDPEVRTSQGGKDWSASRIAVTIPAGRDDEDTIFVGLVAFGRTGESLARHRKGDPLSVIGRISLNRWQTSDGEKRENFQIVADAIVGGRSTRTGRQRERRQRDLGPGPAANQDAPFDDAMDF